MSNDLQACADAVEAQMESMRLRVRGHLDNGHPTLKPTRRQCQELFAEVGTLLEKLRETGVIK